MKTERLATDRMLQRGSIKIRSFNQGGNAGNRASRPLLKHLSGALSKGRGAFYNSIRRNEHVRY